MADYSFKINRTEKMDVESCTINDKLNQTSTFNLNIFGIDKDDDTDIYNGRLLEVFLDTKRIFKGVITNLTFNDGTCTITGQDSGSFQLKNATTSSLDNPREIYDQAFSTTVNTVCDGVIGVGLNDETTQIALRGDYASRLEMLGEGSREVNGDWWCAGHLDLYDNFNTFDEVIWGSQPAWATVASNELSLVGDAADRELRTVYPFTYKTYVTRLELSDTEGTKSWGLKNYYYGRGIYFYSEGSNLKYCVAPIEELEHLYPFNGDTTDEIGTADAYNCWATLTTDRFGNPNGAYNFINRTITDNPSVYFPFVNGNLNSITGVVPFTATGAVPTTDKFGNANRAYYLDGSDDYMESDNAIYDVFGATPVTMACWVYIEELPATACCPLGIYERGNPSHTDKNFTINSNGSVDWWVWDGSTTQKASTNAGRVSAGNWYHLVGTYDGSNVKVYVNGLIGETTDTSAATINFTNPILRVSRIKAGEVTEYFHGKITDILFENTAYNQTQITSLYTNNIYNFMQLPTTATDGLDDFSAFVWIKTTDASASTYNWCIGSITDGGTQNDFHLGLKADGTAIYAIIKNSVIGSDAITAINDGNWHHIGITRSGTVLTFYLDGEKSGDVKACSTDALDPSIIFIGQEPDSSTGSVDYGQAWVGDLDDLALFSKTLSEDEVYQLYKHNMIGTSGLINQGCCHAYSFTGDANDSIGLENGAVTGAALTTDRFGTADSAYVFTAAHSDYISVEDLSGDCNFSDSDNFSISCWFMSSTKADQSISEHWLGSSGGYPWAIRGPKADGSLNFAVYDGSNNPTVTDTSTDYADGNWHHLVVVKDADNDMLYMYVDGSLTGSAEDTTTATTANSDNGFLIGSRQTTTKYFDGKIDEFQIYNVALTAAQVASLYAQTSGYYDDFDNDNVTVTDENNYEIKWFADNARFYANGILRATVTDGVTTGTLYPSFHLFDDTSDTIAVNYCHLDTDTFNSTDERGGYEIAEEWTAWDSDIWGTQEAWATIAGGELTIAGDAGETRTVISETRHQYKTFETYLKITANDDYLSWGFYDVSGTGQRLIFYTDGTNLKVECSSDGSTVWQSEALDLTSITLTDDNTYKIEWEPGEARFYINDTLKRTMNIGIPSIPLPIIAGRVVETDEDIIIDYTHVDTYTFSSDYEGQDTNCDMIINEDVESIKNDITVLGQGDGTSQIKSTAEDATSIATYERKEITFTNRSITTPQTAYEYAYNLLQQYKDPTEVISISNYDTSASEFDLGDTVTVYNTSSAYNGETSRVQSITRTIGGVEDTMRLTVSSDFTSLPEELKSFLDEVSRQGTYDIYGNTYARTMTALVWDSGGLDDAYYNLDSINSTVDLHAGLGSDWWTSADTYCSLSRMAPSDDWEAEAILTFSPTTDYQYAGIFAKVSNTQWIHLARAYDGGANKIVARYEDGGAGTVHASFNTSVTKVWLRIAKDGTTIKFYYKTSEGSAYTQLGTDLTVSFATGYSAGIFTFNTQTSGTSPVAKFHYFDIMAIGSVSSLTVGGNIYAEYGTLYINTIEAEQTLTTGEGLYVHRNLAAASTDSPLVTFWNENASDDQSTLDVLQANTATSAVRIGRDIGFGEENVGFLCPRTDANGTNRFYRNLAAANTAGPVFQVYQDHGSDDQPAQTIVNDGTGYGLYIDQNGATRAVMIECAANNSIGIYINNDQATTDGQYAGIVVKAKYGLDITCDISAGRAANFYRNINEAGSEAVVNITEDHTACTQPTLKIKQDGTGTCIQTTGGKGIYDATATRYYMKYMYSDNAGVSIAGVAAYPNFTTYLTYTVPAKSAPNGILVYISVDNFDSVRKWIRITCDGTKVFPAASAYRDMVYSCSNWTQIIAGTDYTWTNAAVINVDATEYNGGTISDFMILTY